MTSEVGGFRLVEGGPLLLARCEALAGVPGIAHGFSTRRGAGGVDFDLGRASSRGDDHERRHVELLEACGLGGRQAQALEQVHSDRVLKLGDLALESLTRGDAIVALNEDREHGAPGIRYADCLPILLADRRGRAVAAVHAGWRGTAAGLAARAVGRLARCGIDPEGLLAALGPSIGPCCYEVGGEVLEAVARETGVGLKEISRPLPGGTRALDLAEANRLQLVRSGLRPESVHRAPWCTSCEESLFFSFRRDGNAAGRMLACIGWVPDSPVP